MNALLALGLTNIPGLSGLTDLEQIAINVHQHVPSSSPYLIAQAATRYQEEQAALGIHISTVQAVAHVERGAGRSMTTSLAAADISPPYVDPRPQALIIARAATEYQDQQAALGLYVATAQAVAHVERRAGRSMTASLAASDLTPPYVDPRPQALIIAKAATEYQDQQAALGFYVATAQAVAHVERRARSHVA